ncbi:MAG TPA: hypothetical protein VJ803_13810 [Gemmatimonadaceae bacterium]|nr:hypothetical protein [Gemmatimonadaceae bacterium]
MKLTTIKLALALIGIATWGYGTRVENARIQWFGIALVAIAVVLRFVGRGTKDAGRGTRSGTGGE